MLSTTFSYYYHDGYDYYARLDDAEEVSGVLYLMLNMDNYRPKSAVGNKMELSEC